MRTAPDQYWVVGGESGLGARLRSAIPPDAGCVTSLDGARTRLLVEGQAARALLARLVAIDLHPTVFPINGFAQTGIHHVGGLLLRISEDRYEFFALRTFSTPIAIAAVRCETPSCSTRFITCPKARSSTW